MAGNGSREIIGVFHDERALQTAVDELLIAGFDRSCLSLMADPRRVEKMIGHPYETTAELEEDGAVPRIGYVGRDSRIEFQGVAIGVPAYVGAMLSAAAIAASGGTALFVLAGTVVAGVGSGLLGAVLARYIDRHHARYLESQMARGGVLLWVHVKDEGQERIASEVLGRNAAERIHGHDLPAIDYGRLKGGVSRSLSFMNRLGL